MKGKKRKEDDKKRREETKNYVRNHEKKRCVQDKRVIKTMKKEERI